MKRTTMRRLLALAAASVLLSSCSALNPDDLPTPQSVMAGRTINVEVPSAVNLPMASPVVINGINSGVVDAVLPGDGLTVVKLRLRDSAKVSTEAEVELRQDTVLGDTYVSITNPSTPTGKELPADGTLPLAQAAQPVELEALMVSLSNFLGSSSLVQLGGTFSTITGQFPEDTAEVSAISGVLTDTLNTWADNLNDIDSILTDLADLSTNLQSMRGTLEFALSPEGVDQFKGISDSTYMVSILAQVGDAIDPVMPYTPMIASLTRLINTSITPLLIPGWPGNDISNAELLADVVEDKLIPYVKNVPGVNIRSLAVENEVSDHDLSQQLVKVFRTLGWVR